MQLDHASKGVRREGGFPGEGIETIFSARSSSRRRAVVKAVSPVRGLRLMMDTLSCRLVSACREGGFPGEGIETAIASLQAHGAS